MIARAALLVALLAVVSSAPADAGFTTDVLRARAYARERVNRGQFPCLHRLWSNESGWRVRKLGPLTPWGRARGIPQALPGRKMAAAERPARGRLWDDWHSDALVQVAWGLRYIRSRHGTSFHALSFQRRRGWY